MVVFAPPDNQESQSEPKMSDNLIDALDNLRWAIIATHKNVWSVSELALVLGISDARVREMAKKHSIPFYRQNGRMYFRRSDVEAWQTLERQSATYEVQRDAATYCAKKKLSERKKESEVKNVQEK